MEINIISTAIVTLISIVGLLLGFKFELLAKRKINYLSLYALVAYGLLLLFRKLIYSNYLLSLLSIFIFTIMIGALASMYKKNET